MKRVEGVELHYNYRQQGEASNFARLTQRYECLLYTEKVGSSILSSRTKLSQDVASSNVLPPSDAWSEQIQLSHPALFEASSNGRTAGFDPAYRGSNPCASAIWSIVWKENENVMVVQCAAKVGYMDLRMVNNFGMVDHVTSWVKKVVRFMKIDHMIHASHSVVGGSMTLKHFLNG